MSVLFADLGGTNARFAILQSGKMSDIYRYKCCDFKTAYHAILSFLNTIEKMPDSAIIGMAGSVVDGKGHWTNLPWELSEDSLKEKFAFKNVKLLNDLLPQGAGLAGLNSQDIVTLNKAKGNGEIKALMTVGTGLGTCIVCKNNIYPSEYGQTFLSKGIVLESIVSASGLKNIYCSSVRKKISASIIEQRMRENDIKAIQSYETFYTYLAQAVQNLALITQPTGGLYLAGGVLSAADMKKQNIIKQIQNHPNMSSLLKRIPIYIVTNKDLAFVGFKMLAKKYGWT